MKTERHANLFLINRILLILALAILFGRVSSLIADEPIPTDDFFTETQPIGTVNVDVGVSKSGQASVNIPIDVPPGRLGMEPNLSISYSSGGQSGILGMGFMLNGFSMIEKCALDEVHPDRYVEGMVDLCLAGDRLILVDGEHMSVGAHYRLRNTPTTRVDAIERHRQNNGPDAEIAFQANYSDGRVSVFGYDKENSYHADQWHLSYTKDPYDNQVRYFYEPVEHNAQTMGLVPYEIYYTVNGNMNPENGDFSQLDWGTRRVRFTYDNLASGAYTTYTRHGQFRHDRRLDSIETAVLHSGEWNIASTYRFYYTSGWTSARSLLSQVTRCDRENVCLPPVEFEWEMGTSGYTVKNLDSFAVATAPTRSEMKYSVSADFDRDGRDEIAYVSDVDARDSNHKWMVWDPEDGIVKTKARARVVLEPVTEYKEPIDGYRTNVPVTDAEGNFVLRGTSGLRPQVGDFNGDGYPDIVAPYCETDSGRGCLDDAVIGKPFPFANAFNVNIGAGDGTVLYSDETIPVVGAQTVTIDTSKLWGEERVFLTEVGEIDGDGHPDLYICAGNAAHDAWWHLAFNRVSEEETDDFEIVRTWRRCNAWDLYQVDSNGNGQTELHLTKASGYQYRIDACQAANGCENVDSFKHSGEYWAFELPRVAEDESIIPVDEAISRLTPRTFEEAKATLEPSSGWLPGSFWSSITLDTGPRVMNACWNPDELDQEGEMDSVIIDSAGSLKPGAQFLEEQLEALEEYKNEDIGYLKPEALFPNGSGGGRTEEQVEALAAYWSGEISYPELEALFPRGGEGGHINLISPFTTQGPSSDIKVDINGDGLVDIMRLIAVENGGTLAESKHGSVVHDGGSMLGPPLCRADEEFHYIYAYYINHGGNLQLEGHSPVLLTSQKPYLAVMF